MAKQTADFTSKIQGIPCGIKVEYFRQSAGSYNPNAASDVDYFGDVEVDYIILDRKGYPAPWLEAKATEADEDRLIEEVIAHFENVED